MKIKIMFALLSLAVVFFVGSWTMQPAKARWEYKRTFYSFPSDKPEAVDGQINELGSQGWELVAFYPSGSSQFYGLYIFKRAK